MVFERQQGPQASAAAKFADAMLHLSSVAVPDTCGDLDVDLMVAGTPDGAEICWNEAIFVSCWLCK